MTIQQIMEEAISRSRENNDRYGIIARKLQKLIEIKGADCLAANISIEDVNNIKLVNVYV